MKHYLIAIKWSDIKMANKLDKWKYIRTLEVSDGSAVWDYMKEDGWHLYIYGTRKDRDAILHQTLEDEKVDYSPQNVEIKNMLALS